MIKVYVEKNKLREALKALCSLPIGLRPEIYSDSETKMPKSNKVENAREYEQFFSKNASGHFLFSENYTYDFTANFQHNYSSIAAFPTKSESSMRERDALLILRSLTLGQGMAFGFATHWDEYIHRNRYIAKFGKSTFEIWTGRDLSKYLPGVYWITVLSESIAKGVNWPTSEFPPFSQQLDLTNGYVGVKFYENASEWKEKSVWLDRLCLLNPKIFSIERIRPELAAATNSSELTSMLRRWR